MNRVSDHDSEPGARQVAGLRRLTAVLLVAAVGLCGCAWAPPKPWEKGELARR